MNGIKKYWIFCFVIHRDKVILLRNSNNIDVLLELDVLETILIIVKEKG